MSASNAIATQWLHLCRIGCLCILLVFAQAVIAEHLADPDCEDECCYLCQSHGDDEDYIASVDSSNAVKSWFNANPLRHQSRKNTTIGASQIRGPPRHSL